MSLRTWLRQKLRDQLLVAVVESGHLVIVWFSTGRVAFDMHADLVAGLRPDFCIRTLN